LTQELEAQNQKMAVAVTRAAASDELAAQCDHLRSEVEDRDAAVLRHNEEIKVLKRVAEEKDAVENTVRELTKRMEEQGQHLEAVQERLQQMAKEEQELKQKMAEKSITDTEFQAATKKLAKAEAANLQLSHALTPPAEEIPKARAGTHSRETQR